MISYSILGTNNLDKAMAFYDALLTEVGASRIYSSERMAAYGKDGKIGLMICLPHNGKPATVGNGSMIALSAADDDQVGRIYRKALELGGSDEGAPGPRFNGSLYAAYFRDIDGNKLNAIHFKKS